MTGEATRTGRDVSFWGDGSTHWYLDPPLDGHNHIVICDRTALVATRRIEGEPDDHNIATRIPTAVEVFSAKADGTLNGTSMSTLRNLISLRRHTEGINLTDILTRLGYTETT